MRKPDRPEQSSPTSTAPLGEDIPMAVREAAPATPAVPSPRPWRIILPIGGFLAVGAIAVGVGFLATNPDFRSLIAVSPSPSPTLPTPAPAATSQQENVLGHLPYQEASATELIPITADGRIRLRQAAAQKFQEMVAAARNSGIIIAPISGFRTVEEQQHLFFDIKAQRGQAASKRAEVSAPPGYSEHHTGYAIDLGDGNVPATNLSPNFENTAAFRWMQKNAARYSFEMSFPKDNPQGVSYEPWHWRFVGDRHSLETFYKAQSLKKAEEMGR